MKTTTTTCLFLLACAMCIAFTSALTFSSVKISFTDGTASSVTATEVVIGQAGYALEWASDATTAADKAKQVVIQYLKSATDASPVTITTTPATVESGKVSVPTTGLSPSKTGFLRISLKDDQATKTDSPATAPFITYTWNQIQSETCTPKDAKVTCGAKNGHKVYTPTCQKFDGTDTTNAEGKCSGTSPTPTPAAECDLSTPCVVIASAIKVSTTASPPVDVSELNKATSATGYSIVWTVPGGLDAKYTDATVSITFFTSAADLTGTPISTTAKLSDAKAALDISTFPLSTGAYIKLALTSATDIQPVSTVALPVVSYGWAQVKSACTPKNESVLCGEKEGTHTYTVSCNKDNGSGTPAASADTFCTATKPAATASEECSLGKCNSASNLNLNVALLAAVLCVAIACVIM